MMKSQKKIRYLKPKKRPKYPTNYERDYYRILRAVLRRLKTATNNNLPMLSQTLRRDDDSTITDDFIQAILDELLKTMTLEEALQEIELILNGVVSVVDANLIRAFAETVSVDVFLYDSALMKAATAEWRRQQERLVDSIIHNYLDRLQTIISNAVQRGTPMIEVQEEIKQALHVSDVSARRIAMNEVGNLEGIVTMIRQTDCGIDVYQWSTSKDNRVRPAHVDNEGKLFYWHNDKMGEINGVKVYPSPKYHPGMDFNCRCCAIAILDLVKWNMTMAVPLGEPKPKQNRELS